VSIVHYDSYTEARAHLKDLLDAVERGHVATVRRDAAKTAVVDVERLRSSLGSLSAHEAAAETESPDDFKVYADPAGHPFCLCWVQDR
jgi:prevent-host-death family protein